MINQSDMPRTLAQAVRYFADRERCERYMRSIKWPDAKIVCPACGSERIGEVKTRHLIRCKDCASEFSWRTNTMFAESPLTLHHWLTVIWSIANGDGWSSRALSDAIGARQPTIWLMQTRIRAAIHLTHSV